MKKLTLLFMGILLAGFTANAANGFYVSGSSLKDANGNNFIIRGINNPHIWFDTDAYNALTNLAAKKVNTIRIVWTTSGSASRLDQIIQRCIDLQMVPMVELHDGTGSDDPNALNTNAYYYTRSDVKAVLQKYQRYILINIANEWSSGSKTEWDWKEQYKSPINIIRNAGITSTLVIDGPGYGQNSNGALWYGQELLNYDPQHNLLFSIHMYSSWNNSQDIVTQLGNLKYNNIPVVIGEFGYNYNNGGNNLGCKVDHTVVMAQCQAKGYGYIPWSWKGNDASNAWLDQSTDWTNLTWWGNEVFYNVNGINNTSVKASIFTSSSGCGTASNGSPICCNGSSSDPDGDGWGWENNASCVVQSIANGTYEIIAKNSGFALDVSGSSTADGGSIIQWPYGGGNNQKWFVQNLGSGVYSIKNVNSGKSLDVTGASTADGAYIEQWAYSGNNNQKWKIVYVSIGKFKVVSVNSNKCMDVYNASTAQGAQIDQWTCSGNDNQSFGFALLSTATSREGDLEEQVTDNDLTVYPNPSTGSFIVKETGTFDYKIQNTTGNLVEKGNGTDEISAGKNLASGIYILQIQSAKGMKQVKLLKN